jgi:hypothetical protein
VLQMHRPGADGMVIRRGPSVGCEVKSTRMLAQEVANHIMAFLEGGLDIATDSVNGREFEFGPASHEKLTELSIDEAIGRAVAFSKPFDKMRTGLRGGEDTIGNVNRSLALAGECGKNRTAGLGIRIDTRGPDGLFTPALDSMGLEVGCRGAIFLVQKTPDTSCRYLASTSAADEEMASAAIVNLDLDIRLEEEVNR